jgi:2-C-methyl-D-erythritol 4-phosphate cytidylyltransferase
VIAAAILVHAFARPGINGAQIQTQIQAQVQAAVNKAVAEQTDTIVATTNDIRKMYVITTGLERQ